MISHNFKTDATFNEFNVPRNGILKKSFKIHQINYHHKAGDKKKKKRFREGHGNLDSTYVLFFFGNQRQMLTIALITKLQQR